MMLDLLNTAIIDSTFFYLYLGILLITFGIMYFNILYNKSFIDSYSFSDKDQYTKINLNQLGQLMVINEAFVDWLIITFKRIDEKDDKEDNSNSYFNRGFKIRGGARWKKEAYLLPYRNIGF